MSRGRALYSGRMAAGIKEGVARPPANARVILPMLPQRLRDALSAKGEGRDISFLDRTQLRTLGLLALDFDLNRLGREVIKLMGEI